jgi:DNA ligase-1
MLRMFLAEWKWDGIRVQAASRAHGPRMASRCGGFTRAPAMISPAPSPIWSRPCPTTRRWMASFLVLIDGRVQTFNTLQQRLNRKTVSKKLLESHPAHMRVYDVLAARR